jgi:hypothetical protein
VYAWVLYLHKRGRLRVFENWGIEVQTNPSNKQRLPSRARPSRRRTSTTSPSRSPPNTHAPKPPEDKTPSTLKPSSAPAHPSNSPNKPPIANCCSDWLPPLLPHHPLPALDTLLSRLPTLPKARWHEQLTGLAAQGIALEPPAKPLEKPLVLVDGTGWGFDTPYYAPYRRGAAIWSMRSHGKGVVWGCWRGGGVWLVGASLGEA